MQVDTLEIPAFLKIPAAVRNAVWEKNPPRAMPKFSERTSSSAEKVSEEFRAELEAAYIQERDALSAFKRPDTKKAKAYASTLAEKKARSAAPATPVDRTGMRWGRTRGGKSGWVPDFNLGRGSGASLPAPGRKDVAKKPAATGGSAAEREASLQVRGSNPRRSTNKEENHAKVMALLTRPEGATLAEIAAETGWLEHSASAYLTGIRKTQPVPGVVEARGRVYRTEKKA